MERKLTIYFENARIENSNPLFIFQLKVLNLNEIKLIF